VNALVESEKIKDNNSLSYGSLMVFALFACFLLAVFSVKRKGKKLEDRLRATGNIFNILNYCNQQLQTINY